MVPPIFSSARLGEVRPISPEVDLTSDLLVVEALREWFPEVAIDSSDALDAAKEAMPETSPEIHYWVQEMGATNAAFWGMQNDYLEAGSLIASDIGDAWPGVRLREIAFSGWRGRRVSRRGYGIAVSRKTKRRHRVPDGGKATIVEPDLLAWGCIPWSGSYQWLGILLAWRRLAKTPIRKRVRFPGSKGFTAPNFFLVRTTLPTPVLTMNIGTTSNKDQTIGLKGRSPTNYERVLFEDSIEIPKGRSNAFYTVMMFPQARFLLELQPENRTKTILDSLRTTPP